MTQRRSTAALARLLQAAFLPLEAAGSRSVSSSSSAAAAAAAVRTLPYELVTVEQQPSEKPWEPRWNVLLDGRKLKTPAQRVLEVPRRQLALAIAAEWQWQDGRKLMPITMPFMTLACTALDQPKERGAATRELLEYLHSDAALCLHHSAAFAARQEQEFADLRRWAADTFSCEFRTSDSIMGAPQSEDTVAKVRAYLDGLSDFELAAVDALIRATKSIVLGTAVALGRLGAAGAVAAARLEEAAQAEEWGWVEGGHDTDLADLDARIRAPALFLKLL